MRSGIAIVQGSLCGIFKLLFEFLIYMDFFLLRRLVLIRADIARLPFASSSVDAVHAGAALHCWPSPSSAVSSFHLYLVVCRF